MANGSGRGLSEGGVMAERDIFVAALERDDPAERDAYLAQACGGDADLRLRVEHLLRLHADAGRFLEQPAVAPGETVDPPPGEPGHVDVERTRDEPSPLGEGVGAFIGPYKLMQKLGEGGMGVVWVAEQHEPVKRRVALKVIKPGMDSARVLRRFEAERQALALMDHTNIARVFDAGAAAGGRPYFVMELVKGVPITRYCDELHLSVRERLELFVSVCQAIQHAHQKGIIHRDIKPSNVLVAVQDGKPIPKVIDFGVAKALHQRLTDQTMYTEIGQVLGTLEYMSPEQAELSPLDVDTRADAYSLGVVLYELLTGTTPLDPKGVRRAAFSEVLRQIREVEPPRPSTRLTQSKESLAGLAAQRRTDPRGWRGRCAASWTGS
jgi:serine/threonine protein kinase